MKLRTGIALSRKAADLVVVDGQKVVAEAHVARTDGAVAALREVIAAISAEHRRAPVALGLSAGDLAASDRTPVPPGIRDRTLPRVAPALAESRAAGQALEDLAADAIRSGEWLHVVAVRTEVLAEIREFFAAEKLALDLVTALPVAIGSLEPQEPFELVHGGEGVALEPGGGWRSFPVDRDRSSSGPLPEAPNRVGALAAALVDPDRAPNLLRGMPDAPRSFGHRHGRALLAVGLAASLLLGGVGLILRAETQRVESEIALGEQEEMRMWNEFLSGEPPIAGLLIRVMREKLAATGFSASKHDFPSAFRFLAELAGVLPDSEELGLTLEALDLSPEGGRFAATVSADPRDPLKNAARLEAALDGARTIVARGDYETRGELVEVRLRMDYREDARGGAK